VSIIQDAKGQFSKLQYLSIIRHQLTGNRSGDKISQLDDDHDDETADESIL